ncbi:hypothetical protein L1887_13615 [Cichorium endivia]|nr:hypothetical protein L1887_13615 [Cichorium endivia]
MPVSRYQIRNVYSLADPELYKAADRDDPEALLEGVAMAGLVGVLRQLGDLAEFAAEIFHNLHEEVATTAARGHGLLERVHQLELEIPSIERAFLSQTSHSAFFPNSGIDWHPNQKTSQNLITTGDLPRFVMDSYEEARGPPRLFLLDKFDVGGAGACLKRYTDPSFYKVEVSSDEIVNAEIQKHKKIHKTKKKGSQWKTGGTPEVSPPSHAKLHQLFLEDRVQNGTIEPTRRVKLKKRPNKSPFDSETGESYMQKLLNSPSEGKIVHQIPVHPSILPLPSDSLFKDTMGSPFNLATKSRSPSVSVSVENTGRRNPADNLAGKVTDRMISDLTTSSSSEVEEKQIAVDEEIGMDGVQNGDRFDDVASETDNYVDALGTMESELETEGELRAKSYPRIYSDLPSDSQSNSTETTSIVGVTGFTEIPFRPRVPPEKIPGVACVDVDPGVILEKGSIKEADSKEDNETSKNDEHLLSTAGSLLSFQFVRNSEGEVENVHPDDGSSPMIRVPNILETSDKISEEDNHTMDSLPEEQLKQIGDDYGVLHISDSAEAKVSCFSEDEIESNHSEILPAIDAVSDLDDANKSEGNDHQQINKESKEKDTGLVNSEIEVGSTPVSVPDDVDENDENALSTLEDDTELEGKEADSVDSKEMEKITADENNACSTPEEPYENLQSCIIQDSKESCEREEVNLNDDDVKESNTSHAASHDDLNDDDDDVTHSFLEETYQNEQQAANLGNHDLESKSINHEDDIDISKATQSSPVENKVDPQLLLASGTHVDHETPFDTHSESHSVSQQEKPVSVSIPDKPPSLESPHTSGHDIDHFDQVKHQFHSDPYLVNLASQSEEYPQGKPMIISDLVSVSVPVPDKPPTLELLQMNGHDNDLFDQVKHQFNSDPMNLASQSVVHEEDPQGKPITVSVSVPVPDKLPTLKLPQALSDDTNLFDQVKHQSPPVLPGFGMLPETPPVKLEDAPPLPPLPPMQWRMRKLQNGGQGQHSDHNFPPLFQSKPNEGSQVVGPTPLDEASLQTEDRDKSSEAKFEENLVPQKAVETDSGRDIILPSSDPNSNPPPGDEMVTGIRPMKIQRPRSPLIEAVAAHDKSKLRKVSDRAMSQITKGQENDKLLEQIRTKSYNLKPAVQTRPNLHGPTTNVRIAAILEKANAIRQAFAGSDDDDDDSDSWSDS